jgi:hypothetical protein
MLSARRPCHQRPGSQMVSCRKNAAHTMRRGAVLDVNNEFSLLKAILMVPPGCWFIQWMAGRL